MKLTEKQKKALKLLKDRSITYHLHYGGSRSGKTLFDALVVVERALNYPGSKHLVCRASKASCVSSIWMTTLLPLLDRYRDVDGERIWFEDATKRRIVFRNGSEIWAGGFDNTTHTDDLLGKEWATILIEEATELKYTFYQKLLTRLNWQGVPLKLIAECNPPKKSHWLYRWFFLGEDYETREPMDADERARITTLHFHPYDNRENLSPEYIKTLEAMRGSNRKRFFDGVFWEDATGLIYEFSREKNVVDDPIEWTPGAESWRAWDFGIFPSSTFVIFAQILQVPRSEEFPLGIRINLVDEIMDSNKDYLHYATELKKKDNWTEYRDTGDPAGHSRNESLESWITKLRTCGINVQTPHGLSGIDDYISHANKYVHAVRVCEKQCPRTVEFFEGWTREKDRDGRVIEGSKPIHDQFSHGGTAFYYLIAKAFPAKPMFFGQQ